MNKEKLEQKAKLVKEINDHNQSKWIGIIMSIIGFFCFAYGGILLIIFGIIIIIVCSNLKSKKQQKLILLG